MPFKTSYFKTATLAIAYFKFVRIAIQEIHKSDDNAYYGKDWKTGLYFVANEKDYPLLKSESNVSIIAW